MPNFTFTTSEDTFQRLNKFYKLFNISKNTIINEALQKYFLELERHQYINSFERVAGDEEMKMLAELGIEDYFNQINQQNGTL